MDWRQGLSLEQRSDPFLPVPLLATKATSGIGRDSPPRSQQGQSMSMARFARAQGNGSGTRSPKPVARAAVDMLLRADHGGGHSERGKGLPPAPDQIQRLVARR